jgi:integrase
MAWLEKRNDLWYVAYRDATGKTKRIKGYTDRGATKQLMARWEKAQAQGAEGLVDPYAVHKAKPLIQHVADWIAELRQLGRDDVYIRLCEFRMSRLIADCGWSTLEKIAPDSFIKWRETATAEVGHAKEKGSNIKPMSARTKNHYSTTAITFCRWAVKRKRMATNPLADLSGVETAGKLTRERRALSEDEIVALLNAVPPRHKLAYRIILATGLRRDELRQLRWGDVKLNGPMPHIQLRPETTKAKRADVLPLRADLVVLLKDARGDAGDDDPVCRTMPSIASHKLYLERAKIPFTDDRGRRADFHALRHTYGTLLAKAGIAPRVAMSLMRHTDMRLTMNVYTDPRIFDMAGAVEKLALPKIPALEPGVVKATGTDGEVAGKVATATLGGHSESLIDNGHADSETSQVLEEPGVVRSRSSTVAISRQGKKERVKGVEPSTFTLATPSKTRRKARTSRISCKYRRFDCLCK